MVASSRSMGELPLESVECHDYKWELIYPKGSWLGLDDVEFATLEYLEVFRNRQRRQSSLGMRTAIEYEIVHHNNPPIALPSQAR